jgi:hypothetical protein
MGYRHNGALSPDGRRAYAENQRQQKEQEQLRKKQYLAALLERVPEQLPIRYALIEIDSKGEEYTRIISDKVSMLSAQGCISPNTVRYLIETGEQYEKYGGDRTKIIPAPAEVPFTVEDARSCEVEYIG